MDQINILEKEISDLRRILHEKETELQRLKSEWTSGKNANNCQIHQDPCDNIKIRTQIGEKLSKWAIERYSRQILLPSIGVSGQEKLCAAKVLVVGAGGLGCPAAIYLAGAGIGEVGIIDYDTVDVTNIHRQFLHEERDQHNSKAESAANKLRSLNSHIKVTPYNVQLDSTNALTIASKYDIVLDCSDNVPTRYLLNDTCVLLKIPLVSGSALKMEGQLTVYGYRTSSNLTEKKTNYTGPCYRCVFPTPPPAAAVGSCSANGVAGPVPGVIGALQALEAIKYIVGQTREQLLVERMLLFDGEDMTFRTVKLRPRPVSCAACGDCPTVTRLVDYEAFCQAQAKEKKKQESRLKSELRKHEKEKRMCGRAYYGFRTSSSPEKKWIQDVPKAGRKMGPPCSSDICSKGTSKKCLTFDEAMRKEIFTQFWNNLDWAGKRLYVRSLIDSVPVKRRRPNLKGEDLDLEILPSTYRISPKQLVESINKKRHLVIDVRSEAEFQMCKLDGSTNCPIDKLSEEKLQHLLGEIRSGNQDVRNEAEFQMCKLDDSTNCPIDKLTAEKLEPLLSEIRRGNQVTVICRRGNDSQLVAKKLLDALEPNYHGLVKDLAGGLHSWAKHVDQEFPIY